MPGRGPGSESLHGDGEPCADPTSNQPVLDLPVEVDPFSVLRLRGGDGSRGLEDGEPSDDEQPQPPRRRAPASRPRNGPSTPEFQPGSIVRIKVKNFVTYNTAEFFLGPNLNMVIGPNGTGKSSLVCAMCLGLGYGSAVLGRASAFGDYVKHGNEEAELEVELQRKPEDAENYVVGLVIRKEDNSRKFTLNGQRVSLKEIQKLNRSLRIQIDNLCQFLPQEKVAEFAALNPIELLEKTLHAAAPEEMISWQGELKDYFKVQKETESSGEKIRAELRKMEARQQVLQADVEKLRERKAIQEKIENLSKLQVVVRYNEARNKFREAKTKKTDGERSLKRLQETIAPALQAVNKKQESLSKVKLVATDKQQQLRTAERAADDAIAEVEAREGACQDLVAKKDAERGVFGTKKQELGRYRKKITEYQAGLRREPPEFIAADWSRKIRDQEDAVKEKQTEATAVGEEVLQLRTKGNEIRDQLSGLNNSLQNLESQQGQLLVQLKRFNSDVAKGWDWLKDNQAGFEKEVFGPPMLTCSVKDSRYTDLVQAMLQQDDFLCFITQTREDHKKLSDQFYKKMGLSVTIRSCFTPFGSFRPPLPKEELPGLGFEGYVIDYLEGPEPVLAMLCSEKRLHGSALALNGISDEQFDRIQRGEKLTQFAAGRQLYRITRRREYGPGAVSTRVTQFGKGRFWTDQPVDMAEKNELLHKAEEIQAQRSELKGQYEAKLARRQAVEEEKALLVQTVKETQAQKNELQKEFITWRALPDKIETEQKKIELAEAELMACRGRMYEIEKLIDRAILKKAKAILQHHKLIAGIRKARHALLEAQLLLMEAESDVSVLKDRNSEITKQLDDGKKALDRLKAELSELRSIASEAQTQALLVLNEDNRDELQQKGAETTLEEIEQTIHVERAKLEVIQASNPAALEEYERYATRIEKERANQANQDNKLNELNDRIHEIKSQWEPMLDELVSKINDAFSYNFEQINCAGEVGVHKDEDFDKWAIEIKVKFRENETLQRLDQHRQSGGERAVSTIFYLMALQALAQAPFRVVDEINQGMDPRNERMVHERMVEVACREHTSQYFLITPKLLPGLRYDERMRVHTIVSGEHVDKAGTEKMNFQNFVNIQRRLTGR